MLMIEEYVTGKTSYLRLVAAQIANWLRPARRAVEPPDFEPKVVTYSVVAQPDAAIQVVFEHEHNETGVLGNGCPVPDWLLKTWAPPTTEPAAERTDQGSFREITAASQESRDWRVVNTIHAHIQPERNG